MFDDLYSSIATDIDRGNKDLSKTNTKRNLTDIINYQKHTKLGEGTYGDVHKARCRKTKIDFAIKYFKNCNASEGFPISTLREIQILRELKHDNIVYVHDICYSQSDDGAINFCLVFELCCGDLFQLITHNQIVFTPNDRRVIMNQVLNGVAYMHSKNYMHRDLKPANILISKSGNIKIADFGLSRNIKSDKNARYTQNVVTLWYRAPELLFVQGAYNSAVDIWSLGCIFVELWAKFPLFKAGDELSLICEIQKVLGGINNNVWPGIEGKLAPSTGRNQLKEILTARYHLDSMSALNIILEMITYDPARRLTAAQSLRKSYFDQNKELPNRLSQNILNALLLRMN